MEIVYHPSASEELSDHWIPHPIRPGSRGVSRAACRPCFVLAAGFSVLHVMLAVAFPALGEEAYYWEWSRHLSLGYVDQPPMTAWVIRLFSTPFPAGSLLGVRLGSLLMSGGSSLLIYLLGRRLFSDRRVAEWSMILWCCLPLAQCVTGLMIPAVPLLFFYLLFLIFLHWALQGAGARAWCLSGAAFGLMTLSRLDALFVLLPTGLLLVSHTDYRSWLGRKEPYLALLTALLIISPLAYWNFTHQGATFYYQFFDRHQGNFSASVDKICEFVLEQLACAALLAVPLFGTLLASVRRINCRSARDSFRFARAQSAWLLAIFLLIGTFTETHPHWTLLAYPGAVLCVAARLVHSPDDFALRKLRLLAGASAVILVTLGLFITLALSVLKRVDPLLLGPRTKEKLVNVHREFFVWRQLDVHLRDLSSQFPSDSSPLIFAQNHEYASKLSLMRGQDSVVNVTPLTRPECWAGSAQRFYVDHGAFAGRGGIYFGDDTPGQVGELQRAFDRVQELEPLEVEYRRGLTVRYRIFRVGAAKWNQQLAVGD